MVILHPPDRAPGEPNLWLLPVRGSYPTKMPTNGLLRAAEFEPKCVARSARALPTQPSRRQRVQCKFTHLYCSLLQVLPVIQSLTLTNLPNQMILGNVNQCHRALIYELFLKIFYEKRIKQLILFYISHESGVKTFLMWFINHCKPMVFNRLWLKIE